MKHYYAEKTLEEGRVLPEPELEKKGVGYISARHAKHIGEQHDAYIIDDIIAKVKEKVYLTREDVLARPMAIEKNTRDTIRAGGTIYQTSDIREPSQYKRLEKDAVYRQYLLWRDVFAPKYGIVDEPPYSTYKIPVMLNKKRHIKHWIDTIEDRSIAAKLEAFFERTGVEQMSSILVPMHPAACDV